MTEPISLDSFPSEIQAFQRSVVQMNVLPRDPVSIVKTQLCSEVTPADPVSCCASEDIEGAYRAFVGRFFPNAGFLTYGSRFTTNDYQRYLVFLQQEYGAKFYDDPQTCGSHERGAIYLVLIEPEQSHPLGGQEKPPSRKPDRQFSCVWYPEEQEDGSTRIVETCEEFYCSESNGCYEE